MKGIIEEKNFVGSVKDVDVKSLTMSGYLSMFGNVDHDKDVTENTAFTKSVNERGPAGANELFYLNFHKWDQPHNKFQTLKPDNDGLYFEASMVKGVSYSEDTLKLYDAKVLTQFSYGFIPVQKEVKNGVRYLKEVYLLEGSNVTLGANSKTKFTGFKCRTVTEAEDMIKKVMGVIRNGTLTDDTFIQLEIALKQLQRDAYDLGRNSVNEDEPEIDPLGRPNPKYIDSLINVLSQTH